MKTNSTITKMRFYLFVISFFGFTNFSDAQVKATWKGEVDTDFYNQKNWDIPIDFNNLIGTDLIIGAGTPNNPKNIGYSGPEKMPKRPSSLTTNASANIIITGTLFPNGITNLNGTITVDALGAQFSVRNMAYVGKAATGTLNINTGNAFVKNNLYIGNETGGNGLITVNDGTALGIGGSLEIGTGIGDPAGSLKIKGGTVTAESAINIGINGHISINGTGKLVVMGNKEEVLKAYVKSRTIGCTVGKRLDVAFDGTKTSVSINETAIK
jgi:hypothetical protein